MLYSTTTNDQSSFTNTLESSGSVTGGTNVSWTLKSYTVPATAKYVAIHCTSNDQYYFCVDDITISGNAGSGVAAVNIYDNGVLVASNVTGGTYTATNLSVGEHCFSVRAVCNDDSESLAAQQCVTIESNLPRYNVTVNAGNGGSVTPSGEQTVYEGNDFTFTATPNDCYEIASVTVDGNNVSLNANNSYTISNVTANHTVNVTFNQITYTIAASAENGGTITPSGNTTVNCGENQSYTIAANNGYRILDVVVDGQSVGEKVIANPQARFFAFDDKQIPFFPNVFPKLETSGCSLFVLIRQIATADKRVVIGMIANQIPVPFLHQSEPLPFHSKMNGIESMPVLYAFPWNDVKDF